MEKKGIIYKVTHSGSGKVYIGATTIGVEERKKDHIKSSIKGKRYAFQQAIATHGPESFKWEQIDTASTTDELAKKEKEYILKYNSKEEGYNSDEGGGMKKTVYQYDLRGRLVNKFTSLGEAASEESSFKQNISSACLSETHFYKGSLWSYNYKVPFKPNKGVRMKQVVQFDLSGSYIAHYISVAEASRQTGCNKTSIAKVCREERRSSGGYLWKYI